MKKRHVQLGKRVVVRADMAGVVYGTLAAIDSEEVVLTQARQVYGWEGPETTGGLAALGPGPGSQVDVASPMKVLRRADCCAIDTCTPEAVKAFDARQQRRIRLRLRQGHRLG